MMIILLILITLSLDSVWILLGENCCWSLLGLEGLNSTMVLCLVDLGYVHTKADSFALPRKS